MQRCPRCRTNERKLIRFGVYLCPACGETDPDGVVLYAGAATAPPSPDRPSGSAFAAPPPVEYVVPGTPPKPRETEASGSGPPRILVGTVSAMVLLELIGAAGAREACSAILHLGEVGFLLAVLSGKAWARTLGLFSAMAEILLAIFVLALAARIPDARIATFARVWGVVALGMSGFWIYVLMRRDVTDYFVRQAGR